jgi:DNA-binding NarL/FixJ family response regulator
MPTGVLIVDDHEQFRAFARKLLARAGYAVVGEAADGQSAIEASRRLHPDVVLLDVQLPDIDGFAVAHALQVQHPIPLVVLTSARDRTAYRSRLAGLAGSRFISKSDLSSAALSELIGPANA